MQKNYERCLKYLNCCLTQAVDYSIHQSLVYELEMKLVAISLKKYASQRKVRGRTAMFVQKLDHPACLKWFFCSRGHSVHGDRAQHPLKGSDNKIGPFFTNSLSFGDFDFKPDVLSFPSWKQWLHHSPSFMNVMFALKAAFACKHFANF